MKQGSILLAGPEGDLALIWGDGQKDRERAIPMGEYRLRTVRVERAQEDEQWFLSSTGPPGKVLEAFGDEPLVFEIGDEVRFKGHARRNAKGLQLGFGLTAKDGRGLSVYRAGSRVQIGYRVLAEGGEVLAHGSMNYG